MKTAEELNALNEEAKIMNKKLSELTDEDLEQATGGISRKACDYLCPNCNRTFGSYYPPDHCPCCGISGDNVHFKCVNYRL